MGGQSRGQRGRGKWRKVSVRGELAKLEDAEVKIENETRHGWEREKRGRKVRDQGESERG